MLARGEKRCQVGIGPEPYPGPRRGGCGVDVGRGRLRRPGPS